LDPSLSGQFIPRRQDSDQRDYRICRVIREILLAPIILKHKNSNFEVLCQKTEPCLKILFHFPDVSEELNMDYGCFLPTANQASTGLGPIQKEF
jgi:hypothetical protein